MKTKKLLGFLLLLAVIIAAALAAWNRFGKETGGEITPIPTAGVSVVPTAEPTQGTTPTPTVKPVEVTPGPDEILITHTPTPTPEPVYPTETPAPTMEPTAIPTPIVAPTQGPTEPEVTPAPTNTPTPTPITTVWENDIVLMFQMGDDVWYKVLEDGTLVVSGTGATWDFEWDGILNAAKKAGDVFIDETIDGIDYEYYKYIDTVTSIVIEEGITRLGDYALWGRTSVLKVVIPNSLKEVGTRAFQQAGDFNEAETVEWINLDLSKLKCEDNSFVWAKGLEKYEGSTEVMATPTPRPTATPIPSPTPIPAGNPNNPKVVHTEPMGDNVVFEFWDNGYLYVKGTGKTQSVDDGYSWLYREFPFGAQTLVFGTFHQEFIDSIDYLVVEEGITEIGEWVFNDFNFHHIELPSTLKKFKGQVGMGTVDARNKNVYIHGYTDGKEFTVTAKGCYHEVLGYNYFCPLENIFNDITNKDKIKEFQMTVKWH